MINTKSKRKTRSDKFPLTLHRTGQFCKKINGKLHYFGRDKQRALQKYLERATTLHTESTLKSIPPTENISIKALCNLYLDHQKGKVDAGDLSRRYFADQIKSLRNFVNRIGQSLSVSNIKTVDLQRYRNSLLKIYKTSAGVNLNLAIMKAMFHWAKKNEVLQYIPNIDAISKAKTVHKDKSIFSPEEIRKLLAINDSQMRAMVWLGLNCGFGCTDCAQLTWNDLDLTNGRVKLPRGKTGIGRNLPLWPETIDALTKVPKVGQLVFYTSKGNPWVRIIQHVEQDGQTKYAADSALSKKFALLLKKAGIKAEKGVGFYTLRRTAATLAAKSGDPFAVQTLLGHADLKMASVYVQDVSEQTDRAINNSREFLLQEKEQK